MKDQDKTSGKKKQNKMKISNLPNKEFKVLFIKMLIKFRRMKEQSENVNKEEEYIKKQNRRIQ